MRKVAIQVYFEADELDKLRKMSEETEVSMSAIIRRAVRAYFEGKNG